MCVDYHYPATAIDVPVSTAEELAAASLGSWNSHTTETPSATLVHNKKLSRRINTSPNNYTVPFQHLLHYLRYLR